MYRTDFGTLWEKARLGCSKRIAFKQVYYQGWNRLPAQVGCMRQVLRADALGRPRGMGWGGRQEGGSGWGTHVNPWLIHINVWQKPLQYCKVISLQLIKINEETNKQKTHVHWVGDTIQPSHPLLSLSLPTFNLASGSFQMSQLLASGGLSIGVSASTSVLPMNIHDCGSMVKNLPVTQEPQETWIWFLGRKNLLEEEMTTHSRFLAWRLPWTEKPSGLQSMGSQRVGYEWSNLSHMQDLIPSIALLWAWFSAHLQPLNMILWLLQSLWSTQCIFF